MRSTRALMDEISAALQFPHYFGSNWPALGECLSDMDWLPPTPGVVVLMRNAAEVLIEEPAGELEALVHVIDRATRDYAKPIEQGEWWDRPELPFHVVLQVSPDVAGQVEPRWKVAGAEIAPLAG